MHDDKFFMSNIKLQEMIELFLHRAMLELDQILRANEINFAILAALPAFGVSLLLLFAVRAWATHVCITI
jgi:nuclear-control-of-ATPase protein 2